MKLFICTGILCSLRQQISGTNALNGIRPAKMECRSRLHKAAVLQKFAMKLIPHAYAV